MSDTMPESTAMNKENFVTCDLLDANPESQYVCLISKASRFIVLVAKTDFAVKS